MKIKIYLILIFVISFLSCTSNKSFYNIAEVNHASTNGGVITLKVLGSGNDQIYAQDEAEKKAIYTIFFRGVPNSEQKTAMIGTNEAKILEDNKDYFNKFFTEKRYKSFIVSSMLSSELSNDDGETINFDIKVNLISLKNDLEEFNVIRKFGY